ncbi:hypothetical protein D3C76_1543990 [compost metagenome]
MYFGNAATKLGAFLHLADIVEQEQKLTVTCARDHAKIGNSRKIGDKTCILNAFLAAHLFSITFPALAVRRIRKHKVKLTTWKTVRRNCRTVGNVVHLCPPTL